MSGDTGVAVLNPFAYTSREYGAETGNYYYRARFYNARIGRFLSEDPIGFYSGDENFYRYVENGALNFIDPHGLVLWYADKASEEAMKPHIKEM